MDVKEVDHHRHHNCDIHCLDWLGYTNLQHPFQILLCDHERRSIRSFFSIEYIVLGSVVTVVIVVVIGGSLDKREEENSSYKSASSCCEGELSGDTSLLVVLLVFIVVFVNIFMNMSKSSNLCGVERQFAKSIKLTLDIDSNGNYETITADYAKKMFVEMRGRFNVAYNNWKRSGNGRLMANLPENGKLKFHGIDYGKNNDDVEELEFCDDDRYNFCQGKLEVYYFWMCADFIDDCCRVSSSVGELGLTSDDADVRCA